MTHHQLQPEIGQWYLHRDKGDPFQVVGLDEAAGTIEIQSFDGDVDEIELADWQSMDLETGAAPEDWSGPIDTLEAEDRGSPDDATPQLDWQATQHTVPPGEAGEGDAE
ncbi:MAG: hypothetical protein RL026_1949 [Pseudomonadota bacterium]|jgi:hypothetical protein